VHILGAARTGRAGFPHPVVSLDSVYLDGTDQLALWAADYIKHLLQL
jgi:hypothetical protein